MMAVDTKTTTEVRKIAADATAAAQASAAQATHTAGAAFANTAAQARRVTEDGVAGARQYMERNVEQATRAAEGMFKATEEAVEFGRGNLEAVSKATQAYVAGMQDVGRQTFAMFQGLTDRALENAKALAAVRSLREAADLQATFVRTQAERAMAETVRINEAAFRVAEQASAPITGRVTLAAERMARPMTHGASV